MMDAGIMLCQWPGCDNPVIMRTVGRGIDRRFCGAHASLTAKLSSVQHRTLAELCHESIVFALPVSPGNQRTLQSLKRRGLVHSGVEDYRQGVKLPTSLLVWNITGEGRLVAGRLGIAP
jgi:hypothetical protein